jgi:hypothetical protein
MSDLIHSREQACNAHLYQCVLQLRHVQLLQLYVQAILAAAACTGFAQHVWKARYSLQKMQPACKVCQTDISHANMYPDAY